MKKSILVITTLAFSIFHANATNNTYSLNTPTEVVTINKDNIAQVFDFKVIITTGSTKGYTYPEDCANIMTNLVAYNDALVSKTIISQIQF